MTCGECKYIGKPTRSTPGIAPCLSIPDSVRFCHPDMIFYVAVDYPASNCPCFERKEAE